MCDTKACAVCHLHASLDVNYLTERHSDVNESQNHLLKMLQMTEPDMLSFELSFVC